MLNKHRVGVFQGSPCLHLAPSAHLILIYHEPSPQKNEASSNTLSHTNSANPQTQVGSSYMSKGSKFWRACPGPLHPPPKAVKRVTALHSLTPFPIRWQIQDGG